MPVAESYEFRPSVYTQLLFQKPAIHVIAGLRQWTDYAVDGDCELREWEERANEDRSFVDWWDAAWVREAQKKLELCWSCSELADSSDIRGSYPYECCSECYWSLPD